MTPVMGAAERIQRTERVIAYVRAAVVGFNVLVYLTLGPDEPGVLALAVCVGASIYALATLVWQPKEAALARPSALVTMIVDNLLITVWLVATGGFDSPFYPLFYAEAAASVGRFGRKWGFVSSAGSAGLYALVALLDDFDGYPFAVRTAYIFFIAAFVSSIVEDARATEREAANAEREAATYAELDRMRSTFVTNMSHELRTPLTAIRGAANTLWRRHDDITPEQKQLLLEMIDRQSEHLATLVQDIIDVGLADQGSLLPLLERADLAELVEREVAAARRRSGRTVDLKPSETPVLAQVDAEKVSNALRKVIDNAFKFSDRDQPVEVELAQNDEVAEICVVDHGIGIAPKDVDHIFERFYQLDPSQTRSADGAGVGLSIVKTIMTLHGGEVRVVSAPGEGATFRLRFPKQVVRLGDGDSVTGSLAT